MFKECFKDIAIGLIVMFLLLLVADAYTLTILVVYGILALSLGLIWGFGGILCFGQTAFYGLGAYTFAVFSINFGEAWSALFIAIAVSAIFAALLGALLFYGRLGDVYLAVVTLVVTLILFKFMNVTAGEVYKIGSVRLGGFNGIPGFPTLYIPGNKENYLIDESLYYFVFACLIAVFIFSRMLLRSTFGKVVVAIRENETRAELLGYDIRLYKTGLFTIGGAIAGLAGALFANWSEIVTPTLFSLGQSAEAIVWVIFGGVGTLIGPIVGAAVLGILKFFLGQQSVINNTLIMGAILVLAILWLPNGIVPSLKKIYIKIRGKRPSSKRKNRRRESNQHQVDKKNG